jgi:hypothetical protein
MKFNSFWPNAHVHVHWLFAMYTNAVMQTDTDALRQRNDAVCMKLCADGDRVGTSGLQPAAARPAHKLLSQTAANERQSCHTQAEMLNGTGGQPDAETDAGHDTKFSALIQLATSRDVAQMSDPRQHVQLIPRNTKSTKVISTFAHCARRASNADAELALCVSGSGACHRASM